ncbi:LOW QUALITY PROTEIN: uncharacterized protein LOC108108995 [Drosophila eugracilis]|uniref:LOW QUALITY PROTEIN: uncharacterized protein LOC108108995 n=1 Tax=Drosophila eugracilis TaxID=29029 RepID=UPI001BDAE73E|nr:LOW QUALITY PROTEIN: uncharacterized protein LOC108108995 [Drosophila eugracilis]
MSSLKWGPEKGFHKPPGHNMITSQECLQLKRDLDFENQDDFEVSPMILCLMLTFLLFVIGFWIWLISRSCIFAQNVKQQVKLRRTKAKMFVSLMVWLGQNSQNGSSSGLDITSHIWKRNPMNVSYGCSQQDILKPDYCSKMDSPDTSPILVHSVAVKESDTGSLSSCSATSGMKNEKEVVASTSQAVAGSPATNDSTSSPLGMESPQPKRKYGIKWSSFMRRGRRDQSGTS